jgi:hypothetical protein
MVLRLLGVAHLLMLGIGWRGPALRFLALFTLAGFGPKAC